MSGQAITKEQAWQQRDREESIGKIKVGCILGMILVPSFGMLDFAMFDDDYAIRFIIARLACSALIGLFLGILLTPFGKQHYRTFGVALIMLPGAAIAYMIQQTGGWASPYYAGLNLVLLVVGFVLRWTYRESVIAVLLVVAEYVVACIWSVPYRPNGTVVQMSYGHTLLGIEGIKYNNCYFFLATAIIVVTGNYFFSRSRYRQFELAFDLAEQKRIVEANNRQLEQSRLELETSNKKLLELDESKSRFFASISHELRTPLTLMMSPLESILQRTSGTLDGKTEEQLQTMYANGMRLLKLINDLLELVRMESGRIELKEETFNVAELVGGLASAVRQLAHETRLKFEHSVDSGIGYVTLDRDKLEKVLINLIFNALKFTPADGKVILRVELRQGKLHFVVSDTGIGIAPEHLPYIFDRFYQADNSSKRRYRGAGIGLSLVKEFAELQGGKVEVFSKEREGTTFDVIMPYRPATRPARQATPEKSEPPKEDSLGPEQWVVNLYRRAELFPAVASLKKSIPGPDRAKFNSKATVLVADDEPDLLRFLNSELSEDYTVIEAADGQQAVEKAKEFLPDLIVLDYMMPEKDGLEVCSQLRENASTCNIPIIFLTAMAEGGPSKEAMNMAALSAGANDFLTKPFSTAELRARIHNLVENYNFQRQLSRQYKTLENKNDELKNVIEQLKQTEVQLIQTEKLSSLGQLSAGIIHEINNPVNFINSELMYFRKIVQTLPDDRKGEWTQVLQNMQQGVDRVNKIIRGLRTFSSRNQQPSGSVPVAECVDNALLFLNHEIKSSVDVQVEVAPDLTISGERNLMVQVLLNLIKNSIDAMRTKTFENGDRPTIVVSAGAMADHVFVKVRDNGSGIEEKHLTKIFDPFFSTKDQGEGIGLGLSLCYRIVESFGGRITVDTILGQFTEFTMKFPVENSKPTNEAVLRL